MRAAFAFFLSQVLIITSLTPPLPAEASAITLAPIASPLLGGGEMVCAQDLNNNGYAGDPGESAVCKSNITRTEFYCPIGAVQCEKEESVIVRESNGFGCPAGQTLKDGRCYDTITDKNCDKNPAAPKHCGIGLLDGANAGDFTILRGQSVTLHWGGAPPHVYSKYLGPDVPASRRVEIDGYLYWPWKKHTEYWHSGYGTMLEIWGACRCQTEQLIDRGPAIPLCPSGSTYNAEADRCEEIELVDSCPLENGGACVTSADSGRAYCSANRCLNTKDEVTRGNIDGGMLVDNGQRDESGACVDQVLIFNGRASECLPSGVSTGFNNCCDNDQKVQTDSMGSLSTLGSTMSTIKNIYQVTAAAGSAYSSAISAGATQSAAADAAVTAAQTEISALFNPATIAWAIAIYVILDFLLQACDQSCIETAMAAESGFCHEIGSYCKKEWFGSCVQRAKSYCCFNSMMARIVHEQGRAQLNTFDGWGEPEDPDCRGFTPEEFRALDFSKIDLSEYYDELVYRTQQNISDIVKKTTEGYYDAVK